MGLLGGAGADPDPAHPHHPVHPVPHHGAGYHDIPYCANGGHCVPPAHCAPWYLESLYDPAAPCYLGPNTPGVCCVPKKSACKSINKVIIHSLSGQMSHIPCPAFNEKFVLRLCDSHRFARHGKLNHIKMNTKKIGPTLLALFSKTVLIAGRSVC